MTAAAERRCRRRPTRSCAVVGLVAAEPVAHDRKAVQTQLAVLRHVRPARDGMCARPATSRCSQARRTSSRLEGHVLVGVRPDQARLMQSNPQAAPSCMHPTPAQFAWFAQARECVWSVATPGPLNLARDAQRRATSHAGLVFTTASAMGRRGRGSGGVSRRGAGTRRRRRDLRG